MRRSLSMIRSPRRPVVALVGLLVGLGALVGAGGAVAAAQDDVEPRIRTYEERVRTYTIRVESLDGSERDERTADERTVTLDADVLFEFDSDELDGSARSRLDDLVDDLVELGPREVSIDGHTDSTGSASYNQDLSERRAESVRTALAAGLPDGFTFAVVGHGQSDPVADNDTEEGQARNRRVEISFSTN